MSQVQNIAKQVVGIIDRFPKERIKHIVSFKEVQIERFNRIAGIKSKKDVKNNNKLSINISDIVKKSSIPLGLQPDMIKRINNSQINEVMSSEMLQQQKRSLENILNNKHKNYYKIGEKLYKPFGNPEYYERIMDELNGKKKETFGTAIRTVLFGK